MHASVVTVALGLAAGGLAAAALAAMLLALRARRRRRHDDLDDGTYPCPFCGHWNRWSPPIASGDGPSGHLSCRRCGRIIG